MTPASAPVVPWGPSMRAGALRQEPGGDYILSGMPRGMDGGGLGLAASGPPRRGRRYLSSQTSRMSKKSLFRFLFPFTWLRMAWKKGEPAKAG